MRVEKIRSHTPTLNLNIMKTILRQYPLTILLALVIWVVCLIPVPETPLNDVSFIDKWTHFVMYAVLTLVLLYEHRRALRSDVNVTPAGHKKSNSGSAWLLLLPISQGCLVELAQAYLTTCRSGDWFDALCNTLGVLIGAGIGKLIIK